MGTLAFFSNNTRRPTDVIFQWPICSMPSPDHFLGSLSQADSVIFDRIHHANVDVMVHAAGRYLHLLAFHAKDRTDVFAVGALHFHVLFDLRSIRHLEISYMFVVSRFAGLGPPFRLRI
jgi:hypothetical protein